MAKKLQKLPLTRDWTPARFQLTQAGLTLACFAGLLWLSHTTRFYIDLRLLALGALLLGWYGPVLALNLMLWQRSQSIARGYSELVAHLVLMTQAGAPVLQAFASSPAVVREPLRSELEELVADARLAPLPSALERFAARTENPEIELFARTVVHQQSVGIGLNEALAQEESHSQVLFREAVRQRIRSATVTMAAVTVVLLINGLTALLTPTVLRLMEEWAAGGGLGY